MPLCGQCVVIPLDDGCKEEVKAVSVYKIDKEDWHEPLTDNLDHKKLPSELRRKIEAQQRALRCLHYKGAIY